jgi:hypothetical protein
VMLRNRQCYLPVADDMYSEPPSRMVDLRSWITWPGQLMLHNVTAGFGVAIAFTVVGLAFRALGF